MYECMYMYMYVKVRMNSFILGKKLKTVYRVVGGGLEGEGETLWFSIMGEMG